MQHGQQLAAQPQTFGMPVNAPNPNGTVAIEQSRAITEVQGAIMMAKRFPRDEQRALEKILDGCKYVGLAEVAQYAYPRGGEMVEGPSIHLAKEMARHWGNIQFDIVELSQDNERGISEIMAYAWDLETNHRPSRSFKVTHERYTKKGGRKRLIDPRDIYEHTANFGARRLRACILDLLPDWAVQAAVEACNKTLLQNSEQSLQDNLNKMVKAFTEYGVTKDHIEKRLGHNLDATTAAELVTLRKIYRSLKDGMTKASDVFDLPASGAAEDGSKSDEINQMLAGEQNAPKQDAPAEQKKSSSEGQPEQPAADAPTEPSGEPAQEQPEATEQEPAAEPAQEQGSMLNDDTPKQIEVLYRMPEDMTKETVTNAAKRARNLLQHMQNNATPAERSAMFNAAGSDELLDKLGKGGQGPLAEKIRNALKEGEVQQ